MTTTPVTTLNWRNKEVFKSGTTISQIMTFLVMRGVEECEQVIKETYTKNDAENIIAAVNLTMACA